MTRLALRTLAALCLCGLSAAAAGPAGFPFTDEDLNYSVNWPTGVSLGEAHLHAKHAGANWNFAFDIEAGVPGFQVKDTYRAEAGPDLCSMSFSRDTTHGARVTDETETVDRSRALATRSTKGTAAGGGQSEIPVQDCVKDALTFLFYTREEMGQGRVPATQQILLGGLYEMSLSYTGAPTIPVGGKQVQSDELVCTFKGRSSTFTFEMYFARDAARTPLLVKAPLAMGTFSMELLRPELLHMESPR